VAPDAIYVGRVGPRSGLSVIDLNGFGASTGDPTFSPVYGPGSEGTSHFPFNPNVALQGALLLPPLGPGSTTRDGGSSGVFTLTRDSELDDLLFGFPTTRELDDLMLGHPLDLVFHNGVPFGCQAGGGNLCASTGLKLAELAFVGPHSLVPSSSPVSTIQTVQGLGNLISWAPHPNPPPLLPVPLCLDPPIDGAEPTADPAIGVVGLVNLLVPGDAFGDPSIGLPPTGLLARQQNAFFVGPGLPAPSVSQCAPFAMRQQVGHFLYAIDRAHDDVVVLNSNRMLVLDRIAVEDPTELAMSPDLRFLAVTSRATGTVAFVDIDPASSAFHTVVHVENVGLRPRGIAWDPGNEDVLVCNEGDGTVSILSAFSLQVRRVLAGLDRPFAVAITPRQDRFGSQRDVYFAYVLDRAGRVSLYESGPNGVNGWGFDDIVLQTDFRFFAPRAIQPDPMRLTSGVWIAHRFQLGPDGTPTGLHGGAVSNLVLEHATSGRLPLLPGEAPNPRGLSFRIERSIGSDQLSGFPTDLAFDDQSNLGALRDYVTPFSAGTPAPVNGKNLVREVPGTGILPTNAPRFLLLPTHGGDLASAGVDVIDMASGERVDTNPFRPGVQSIPAPGAKTVMHYFRQ